MSRCDNLLCHATHVTCRGFRRSFWRDSGEREQTVDAEGPSYVRIATLENLSEHLQWAIGLEHFTLPPYLCALYSIVSVGNMSSRRSLSSVSAPRACRLQSDHWQWRQRMASEPIESQRE